MMRPLFDITPLREDIESGTLILTPNNRLASKICQAWGMLQQQSGRDCWPKPNVDAIESWIDELWLSCCDLGFSAAISGTPVSMEMELLLWEQVIDEDRAKPGTLLPENFSRQARNAYAIVQRWQIPDQRLQREVPMLWQWIESFREKLVKHQLITPSDKTIIVLKALVEDVLPQVEHIHLCGFDSLPPLFRTLLNTASMQLTESSIAPGNHNARQATLYSEQQELETAAAWAVDRFKADPEARIGIIIPELPRLRSQIERLLHTHLHPQYNQPGQPRTAPPFNLSAGIALADTPPVAAALLLLGLNRPQLPLESLCRILNSPFWGEANSALRANAETRLREKANPQPRCSEFRYQLARTEEREGGEESHLSSRLEKVETLRREMPRSASYSQWLQLFKAQLDALGWPGERRLDSIEYQQLQHWHTLLEQYQRFDQLGITVELNQALRQLQQLAGGMVFQPETPDAPIQILGLLEGSGLRFDHLWIMGMDNRRWPQPIAPNPLLPIALQRELNTPRSHPDHELQLAKAQLAGFLRAAPKVVLSHSQFDGDQPLQPSELIAEIKVLDDSELPSASSLPVKFADLEPVSCEYGPPLDLQREQISGGTGIFKNQAGCPFNAFSIHRLGARQPPEPTLGLSSAERGNLVHDCLERLWGQLQNQQQLLALNDEALQQLISQTVTASLQSWRKERPELFGPAFALIEQQRLSDLLQQWLALEKIRPPFQISALENQVKTEYAGLPLRMTIDRIDQLDGGQQVIIDYKTGSASPNRWLGERPEEPQLPLYLLCSSEPVSALSFAQINASEQRFLGFADTNGLLPGIKSPGDKATEPASWEALIDQWQQVLNDLAEEFKSGYAAVQFHNQNTRQYQAYLEPLNRISEAVTGNNTEENDE